MLSYENISMRKFGTVEGNSNIHENQLTHRGRAITPMIMPHLHLSTKVFKIANIQNTCLAFTLNTGLYRPKVVD